MLTRSERKIHGLGSPLSPESPDPRWTRLDPPTLHAAEGVVRFAHATFGLKRDSMGRMRLCHSLKQMPLAPR